MNELKSPAKSDKPKGTIAKKRRAKKAKKQPAKDGCEMFGFSIDALRRYETIRCTGMVNMLDPRVQKLANITEEQHASIISCPYQALVNRYINTPTK